MEVSSATIFFDSHELCSPVKHRGHAFVEFLEEEDAQHAIDNMDASELFGRVIKVAVSKSQQQTGAWSQPSSEEGIITYSEPAKPRQPRTDDKVKIME